MSSDLTPAITQLAQLLEKTGATSVLRQGRVVPSVVYDLRYRMIITSCAFRAYSRPHPDRPNTAWVRSDKLKFVQFVAIRPWLVATVRQWSVSRGDTQRSMLTSDRLRKGFIGDTIHDRVVEFLVASGVMFRFPNGTHVASGRSADLMERLELDVTANQLFAAERGALAALSQIRITTDMLEGL